MSILCCLFSYLQIYRILSFTQRLKTWIDLCNEQRKAVRSEFESDFAKLQANTTFDKTMELVRYQVNVRQIADLNKLLKAVAKLSLRDREREREKEINQDLVLLRET